MPATPMRAPIYQLDSFTTERFRGNPAAVVVLLKHPDGEWRGPRLAYYTDGSFEGHDAEGDGPDGWQVYAWRPATIHDAARLPPMATRDAQRSPRPIVSRR